MTAPEGRRAQGRALGAQESDRPKLDKNWRFFAGFWGVLVALAIAVSVLWLGSGRDDVSPQDLDRMNASWASAVQNRVGLAAVAPEDIERALASTGLSADKRSELEKSVRNGATELVWLTLWDTQSEDGDVAAFESEGLRIMAPLLKRQTSIALPRPAGGVINLVGVKDGGGGGVTVGVLSDGREVLIPPLAEGQSVGIPVR